MNELTKIIKKDVKYMEKTHVNDPETMVLLDKIEKLLSQDVVKTTEILNELDLLSIEWISSTFEKVSYELQNKDFINCLDELLEKFSPDINGFKNEVQEAREAYYGN